MIKTKKAFGLFLICAIFFSFSFSALAAEKAQEYNLSQLVEKVLKNNPAIKSAELKKESGLETLTNAGKATSFIPTPGLYNEMLLDMANYKTYKTLDISYNLSKDTLQMEIDKAIKDLLSTYYLVLNTINELELVNIELKEKEKEYVIATKKYDLGMISRIEFDSLRKGLTVNKTDQELIEDKVKKSLEKLREITGIKNLNPGDLIYEEWYDISINLSEEDYKVLKNRAQENNIILQMSEKKLQIKQLDLDYFILNSGPQSYNAATEEMIAEELSYKNTKESLDFVIDDLIFNIKSLKKSYSDLLIKGEIDNEMHQISQLQFNLGMITERDIEESKLNLLNNKKNLDLLKSGFNEALFVINNLHVQLN